MLKNYFKIVLRTLTKNKRFTAIHITGLTLGLTACLLISFFILHEISFDRFHEKADRTYRLSTIETSKNGVRYSGGTPYPFAEALRIDDPGFETITQIHPIDEVSVTLSDGNQLLLENLLFVDSNFFSVFDFEIALGDPSSILSSPGLAFITEQSANLLFGELDPIGRMIKINGEFDIEIAGLIKGQRNQTHLPTSLVLSLSSLNRELVGMRYKSWGVTSGGATYCVLSPGDHPSDFRSPLQNFADKYMNSDGGGFAHAVTLQPLTSIHFQPEYRSSSPIQPIRPLYLWIFAGIGLLILLSAAFNFINLATVQAIKRSREVGVRKVLGASRRQLMFQFLGEALAISIPAGILAAIFTQLCIPYVNSLLDKQINPEIFHSTIHWLILLIMPVMIGLFSGIYPAFVLANHKPVKALTARSERGKPQNLIIRRGLVLMQFTITLSLIMATLIVTKQVRFMRDKDLGFDQDGVVMIDIPDQQNLEQLRTELMRSPDISKVSFSLGAPTSVNNIGTSFYPKGEDEASSTERVSLKMIDHTYQELFGLELVAGRWLTEAECRRSDLDVPDDAKSYAFMVNEALIKRMGIHDPSLAIGKTLVTGINNMEAEIIGVVKDFHARSLHNEIEPTLFLHFPSFNYRAGLKINMNNASTAIAFMETTWNEHFPDGFFSYDFLDATIDRLYADENRLHHLFKLFAGLAIFIGALGLLGLVSFITEQRTKEIGIRKVLGASNASLLLLISKEFLAIVILAMIIAIPIALYAMNTWLNYFAFRTSIGTSAILIAFLLAILITLLTVGLQAWRAANLNPIESLRDE